MDDIMENMRLSLSMGQELDSPYARWKFKLKLKLGQNNIRPFHTRSRSLVSIASHEQCWQVDRASRATISSGGALLGYQYRSRGSVRSDQSQLTMGSGRR